MKSMYEFQFHLYISKSTIYKWVESSKNRNKNNKKIYVFFRKNKFGKLEHIDFLRNPRTFLLINNKNISYLVDAMLIKYKLTSIFFLPKTFILSSISYRFLHHASCFIPSLINDVLNIFIGEV
jgi:hypothetical protein